MNLRKTGSFIAIKRREKGMTQAQLAEHLHISDKAVSKWETGRGFPDISVVESLCEALDISIEELIKGEPLKQSAPQSTTPASLLINEKGSMGQDDIELLYREKIRFRTIQIIKAVIAIMIALVLSGVVYRAAFNYDISSFDILKQEIIHDLSLDIDTEKFGVQTEPEIDILEMSSLGTRCFVIFKTDYYSDGEGIAVLEKGILGGFRFLDCEISSWPLYDFRKTRYKGSRYLAVFGNNDIRDAASFRIYQNDDGQIFGAPELKDRGELIAEGQVQQAPFIQFIQTGSKDSFFEKNFCYIYYYDKDGEELDRVSLAKSFNMVHSSQYAVSNGNTISYEINSRVLSVGGRKFHGRSAGSIFYLLDGLILLVGICCAWNAVRKILWADNRSLFHHLVVQPVKNAEKKRLDPSLSEDELVDLFERRRKIRKGVIIALICIAAAAVIVLNISYNQKRQETLAESSAVSDVFLAGEDMYVIWDVPYYSFNGVAHKFMLQKDGEEGEIRLPGKGQVFDQINARILYTKGASLYACDLEGKHSIRLFKAPRGNDLSYNIYGKYALITGREVSTGRYSSNAPMGYYHLLDLESGEISRLQLAASENEYLIAINDEDIFLGRMSMGASAGGMPVNYRGLIRYDIASGQTKTVSEAFESELTNPGYVYKGYLYFAYYSSPRVYRIAVSGGDIELLELPYSEMNLNAISCLAGEEGTLYIVGDDRKDNMEPKHIYLYRLDLDAQEDPELTGSADIGSSVITHRFQDGRFLFGTYWPDRRTGALDLK